MKRISLLAWLLIFPSLMAAQTPPAPVSTSSTGTWKVDGDVEGVPVSLTCVIAETAKTLTGTCTGSDGVAHAIKGKVNEQVVTWAFDSIYQGQPITLTLSGTIDATTRKMTGSIAVDPLQADGEFTATKRPTSVPK